MVLLAALVVFRLPRDGSKSSRVRVCLVFRFLFLNSLRLFNFIHACVPLITPAIETRPSFFAISFICVFRCEKFGPGDEASLCIAIDIRYTYISTASVVGVSTIANQPASATMHTNIISTGTCGNNMKCTFALYRRFCLLAMVHDKL